MKQLGVFKKWGKFYTKIYGTEYELIMPVEESPESKKMKVKEKKAKAEKKITE